MTREVVFRVPPEIFDAMAVAAKRDLLSVSAFVRVAVARALAERDTKHAERPA
jgi:predicted HicB family RNase H-like nuclease